METIRTDAVVIGGGLAGVTAARDLAHGGARTLLVEARDRLGGRTATQTLAGREIDTGGTYFHWFQAAIWAEVLRYELPLVERPVGERFLVPTGDGHGWMDPLELDERLRRALPLFWGDPAYAAGLTRPFAVQQEPAWAELDARSVGERLREIALDPVDDALLQAMFTDFGRPLDEVSLAWVLQRMSNGVWTYEAFDALFAVYRLRDGMRSLVDAIVEDGGCEVRLSSPVAAIEHDDAGGRVRLADGTVVEAKVVVVATPVNVWRSIDFAPALPALHAAASDDGVAVPTLTNVIMHVRGIDVPINGFIPYGEAPFEILFTAQMLDDGQLLGGYSTNGSVTLAGGREQLAAALRRMVPEAELVDFVGHDWTTDPYALGGNGALAVGQLTRYCDVLDRPVGRLLFASADVSSHFPGFLTGAIEAGARAAQRARPLLR